MRLWLCVCLFVYAYAPVVSVESPYDYYVLFNWQNQYHQVYHYHSQNKFYNHHHNLRDIVLNLQPLSVIQDPIIIFFLSETRISICNIFGSYDCQLLQSIDMCTFLLQSYYVAILLITHMFFYVNKFFNAKLQCYFVTSFTFFIVFRYIGYSDCRLLCRFFLLVSF